ncbi:MAG: chemotaxis protein CheW [Anaerolineaceae bacterium]|nr:chemotaxis protein CheW [Anaerolineaceae bacterium]
MPPSPKPKRQRVDWEAVWKGLNWDDDMRQASADDQRLRQRAEQYAAPITAPDDLGEDALTVLSFDLGAETYSVDVALVRGVRPLNRLVRVPGAPLFYPGVVNVRGKIITVMDLRPFFGIPIPTDKEVIVPDEVVLVRANHLEIALLAHQVNGVQTIPRGAIHPLDNMRYTRGITLERMIMLDMEHLLADDRIIVGTKHD